MARPTKEEIDAWNARMSEPEGDADDFEVEIFTPEGHGARVPYGKARKYLQDHFGIDLELPKPEGQGGAAGNGVQDPPGTAPGGDRPSQRYFGKKAP